MVDLDVYRLVLCALKLNIVLDVNYANLVWKLWSTLQGKEWDVIKKYTDEELLLIIEEIIESDNFWRKYK